MTGYQEIYTDPSLLRIDHRQYHRHIGNYGTVNDEQESAKPQIAGIVVNEFSNEFSRLTARESLQQYLEKHGVVGISDVDTRMLVRYIRSKGAMNALISSVLTPDQMKDELRKVPSMDGLELSSVVSTTKAYFFGNPSAKYRIAASDGYQTKILKNLADRDCYIQVFRRPPSPKWRNGNPTVTSSRMAPAIRP